MPALSIIIPVLDEQSGIAAALQAVADYRRHGHEVIVVDGGSRDRTVECARPLADAVIAAPRGRAAQMNAGAAAATGDIFVFLHADTRLPFAADCLIVEGLRRSPRRWGRFDVAIAGRNPLLRVVAAMMNLRSRLTGIATGDQAIFVTRDAFTKIGGYPDIPLMEDIALSRMLKRIGRPLCLRERVVTSGRRWEQRGPIRTILLMWRLRLAYVLGVDPNALARRYGYVPRDD
jgi:rSAM/selenodomain-associated transferase 2